MTRVIFQSYRFIRSYPLPHILIRFLRGARYLTVCLSAQGRGACLTSSIFCGCGHLRKEWFCVFCVWLNCALSLWNIWANRHNSELHFFVHFMRYTQQHHDNSNCVSPPRTCFTIFYPKFAKLPFPWLLRLSIGHLHFF